MSGQDHVKPSAGESGAAGAGVPLWESISRDLRRRLQEGEFTAGFPGELSLAREYNASRGSIRAALRPLREAGLVSAERGRKPVALPPVIAGKSQAYGPVYSLFATLQEAGLEHSSDILAQEIEQNPAAAARLGLPAGEPLFRLARRRCAQGVPLAVDEVWLQASRCRPLLAADFSNSALYEELETRCGIRLDGGEEKLTAVAATPELSASLNCPSGAALLFIERLGCSNGVPVEFRRSYVLAENYTVSTTFGTRAPR
ncbi:GntR family transcriptional regulator [Arthrobacter crystallopoietes]|uniref:Transcriptional regulator, GntR family n=1 Tax=Crystallibacter crystallopoietes TaxID=37928 RepID=A0A1H1HZN3_9MICC|nr:GntR family transcriptional regulator [Arthrobacter crystallopoietes]SDR30568.1 transcriptional regulator, GntR family [Arthrobacter crystallopoietes]